MRKILVVVASALSLGGCASAEQLAQRDAATCQSYGYSPGTPNYGPCLEKQAELRAYAAAQRRAAFAAAMANTGQMYQQRAAQAQAAAQAPMPQTCHTMLDPATNTATTHCY